MEEKAEEKIEEKEEENLKWDKTTQFGPIDSIEPVLNAMLMLVEVEKQKTLEQIEQVKKILETMKNQK